jgi:hypothetical protein
MIALVLSIIQTEIEYSFMKVSFGSDASSCAFISNSEPFDVLNLHIPPLHLKFTPIFTATVKSDCLTKLFGLASAKECVVQNIDCYASSLLVTSCGYGT